MPRVLIADDDPVSLHFLAAAVSSFGCDVVAADTAAQALSAAKSAPIDLLLLDRRMPGMGGVELLAALRNDGVGAPALATSAEVDATIDVRLRTAGFLDVLVKPLSIETLRAHLLPYLPPDVNHAPPLLDDAAATAAVGNDMRVLRALRQLFVGELAELENACSGNAGVIEADRLHRLRAACGFCGAIALGQAAQGLEKALHDEPANASTLCAEFLRLCRSTRDRLILDGNVSDGTISRRRGLIRTCSTRAMAGHPDDAQSTRA